MADSTFVYLLTAERDDGNASVIAAFETEEAARRAGAGLDITARYEVYQCPLFASGSAFLRAQRVPAEVEA